MVLLPLNIILNTYVSYESVSDSLYQEMDEEIELDLCVKGGI